MFSALSRPAGKGSACQTRKRKNRAYRSNYISLTTTENQPGEQWPEDFSELEELVDQGEPTDTDSSRRSFIWLQAIAFLLGLGLLIYVINRVGLQPIFDALLRIGFFGFLIL